MRQFEEERKRQTEDERKQKIEKERDRKFEKEIKHEKIAWKLWGLYDSDDDIDEEEVLEMVKQQYKDYNCDNFLCS